MRGQPLLDMSDRTRFVTDPGTRTQILRMDFSGFTAAADALPHISAARSIVAGMPERSLRTLVLVSGSKFNTAVAEALKELAAHNRPFVIAGTVVGMSGLQKVIYQGVLAFTGRTNLRAFDTEQEAVRWLVEQR